jgi:hypothetical protein
LIVNPARPSIGLSFIWWQAKLQTSIKLLLGAEPGLKSEAKAKGSPASMIDLPGVYGMSKKREQPGRATGIGPEPADQAFDRSVTSWDVMTSKWSTLRAFEAILA